MQAPMGQQPHPGTWATLTRLSGKEGALNGKHCEVLRPGDGGTWVVATSRGELTVTAQQLSLDRVPSSALAALAILSSVTSLLLADLWLVRGRKALNAGLTPVMAVLYLLVTLVCCYRIHEPLMTVGVSVPAISEMGIFEPGRRVYRVGFSMVGTLFACTIWLYDKLLVPADKREIAGIMAGYAAAAGVAIQGIFTLEVELNWRTLLHFAGALLFVFGTMQHAHSSSLVLPPSKGAVFRKACSEQAPVFFMLLPLGHQVLRRMAIGRGALEADGLQNAMGMAQWALVLNFAAFFCSYSPDFVYAAA